MKYLDEYRNDQLVKKLISKISLLSQMYSQKITLMEVCGTHTMAIFRSGLRHLLPTSIRLLSGPGCPVCVTSNHYIDKAIAYAKKSDVIVTTFGDMMRVPGSTSSLEKIKAERGNVYVVYSPLDALKIAQDNPNFKVIFLGVGFETTSPTIAATIKMAKYKNIKNFFVYSAHKLIPPALKALLDARDIRIGGFILPGHVSTIIGSRCYEFIPEEFNVACVITGFEPLDIAQGTLMLLNQIVNNSPKVEIQYRRSVREIGNPKALTLLEEVFETTDSYWRGIGLIPESGLKIRSYYAMFDAELNISVDVEPTKEKKGCICGEILRGIKTPLDCSLFGKLCTPENPIGACMVSSEGTCSAYYKYRNVTL